MNIGKMETGQMGLLDKFKLELKDGGENCIVAVDPGAGEWAGACIYPGESEVKDLYVDSSKVPVKDYSVLYHSKKEEIWHIGGEAANLVENEGVEEGFFENYKVMPSSRDARECYGGNYENPSKKELMMQSFQCIMERIFVDGDNGLAGKDCILFVGRPSSKGWEKDEIVYCEMLREALKRSGVAKEKIQIAVISEAQAALAAEIYGRGLDLKSEFCQIVVDLGSSTTDALVVKNGKVIGEYSRQLGAGCIEENMLELWMYDDCEPSGTGVSYLEKYAPHDNDYWQVISYKKELREKLERVPYVSVDSAKEFKFSGKSKFYKLLDQPAPYVRFELRKNKEDYFGPHGNDGVKRRGMLIYICEEVEKCTINEKTMDKAIKRMPVFVPGTESEERNNPYKRSYIYRSYYDALAHFMDGLKDMYLQNERSPEVILTGGAAVMPVVKQLVKEKFGVEPKYSNQPSYTVSRGLAYIGYAEIRKQEEFRAINQIIEKAFEKEKNTLSDNITEAFSKWYVYKLKGTLRNWWERGQGTSLRMALNSDGTYEYSSQDLAEKKLVEKWWRENVKPEIVKEIRVRFKKICKNENVQYNFVIDQQIVDNAYGKGIVTEVNINLKALFGGWTAFWIDLDKTDYTKEKRLDFYNKAKAHGEEMTTDVKWQKNVRDLGKRHTNEILDGFKRELYKDVVAYVEGLTPYIIRQ